MSDLHASDTYARLTPIFREIFDDEAMTLTPAMTASDVEGWDSLAHIRLIVSAEEAFEVRFSAAEVTALANVGEFVKLIDAKRLR